jgi:hypothetical protein
LILRVCKMRGSEQPSYLSEWRLWFGNAVTILT